MFGTQGIAAKNSLFFCSFGCWTVQKVTEHIRDFLCYTFELKGVLAFVNGISNIQLSR
jgi:hypothetical protein